MSIGQLVGSVMVGVFAVGLLYVVKDAIGSWGKAALIVLGASAAALWLVVGVVLIKG